ncbi:MAG: tRNA lysidine(34) synthetase TilS, partial [Dehalococcoidia bacterium]
AETVLLHILRGSGVAGLGAMTPRSAWPFGDGPDIVRPLLELRREDTEQYCRESGVQPRHDPTNDLPVATRNRVRHELMPALRQFNPRVEEALARLADAAALDDDFVELVADRDWTALASATRERVTFPRLAFASFHPAVQARLLMRAAEKLGGADASLTSGHVDEVRFALDRRASRLSLPGGLVCAIGSQRISITRGAEKKLTPAPETVLAVPGKVSWGHWTIIATKASGRLPKKISHDEAYLAKAAVKGSLLVRARQPGDRLRPLGLRGEKKVQDILVDAKVSEEERDAVPIVCDDAGVIWIAGHRLAERAAVRKAGEMVHLRVARRRAPRR